MKAVKCILAVFSLLAAAAAVAGAAYMVYQYLYKKPDASACIECDCGTEFEAE